MQESRRHWFELSVNPSRIGRALTKEQYREASRYLRVARNTIEERMSMAKNKQRRYSGGGEDKPPKPTPK